MAVDKMSPFSCSETLVTGYENMSNEELYFLLREKAPAVAQAAKDVSDSNRETVIAFLILLSAGTTA
jgi:hypothetical protein